MAETAYPELISNTRDSGGDQKTNHLIEYYSRIGQWCDSAYEEGVSLQQDVVELREVQGAIDYLAGLQWKDSMPSYRAKPVSNEMLQMFWETVGLLTDIKPMFNIRDIGGNMGAKTDYQNIASILNAMAKGWTSTFKFERSLAFCIMFGTLTDAPAKIYWNPFARGNSGDPGDADITMEYLPASSLLRLGAGEDYQEDECLIYRRVRTLDWIKRAYPRMGKLVKAEQAKSKYTVDVQTPVTVMPQMFQTLSPAAKRLMGGSEKNQIESVYPRAEVREFWKNDDSINESRNKVWMGPAEAAWGYWVEPGKKLYPRGRLIIRANSVTLYDEPNPYFHRKKPFARLGLCAVPWQQYAMSLISPWMKQQDILNQIMAGVIQNIKKAVNPPLMASKTAINPEAMRAIDSSKPNLKITYSQNAGSPPVWGKPPDLPGYVFQGYNTVKQSMTQSSGAAAVGDAAGKKQVPGGDTMDKITFAKNTPIRHMGRNVEYFVDDIGGMWTANALQFYDASRRVEALGDKGLDKSDMDDNPGSLIPQGINSEAFVQRWHFKTVPGTLLNVTRNDKIPVAFALRKNHDLSRAGVYRILQWDIDEKQNDAELQVEAEAMAKAQAAAGIKPGAKGGHK